MKKCSRYLLTILALIVLSTSVLVYALRDNEVAIDSYSTIDRAAKIRPDYSGSVIPTNIAPLNFVVREDGSHYCVKIYSKKGESIEVFSRSGKIVIPAEPWHKLLNANRAEELHFDVFVKENNQWSLFSTITNKIANETIDGYLVYRKIYPSHSKWWEMGIYQRNLQNYDELLILDNGYYKSGCVNCHSFCNNRTDKMLIDIRSHEYGSSTLLIESGVVNKIGTKFGFSSWHPSGQLVVYTINKFKQCYHSARNEVRDVIELDSSLAYYLIDSKTIKTSPNISKKNCLESYPTWSPDGRYLYFCTAPILWPDRNKVPPEHYNEVKYDLVRISYDLENDTWGELETVLSSEDTGLSILEPKVSPDGRWLLFCMCKYGTWTVYQASSDLYLMDIKALEETGLCKYRRLNINSDQSESWHSWFSNSRWIVFSSKRDGGVFTRSYLSYVDKQGKVYKPLLVPQKDPTFYDYYLKSYTFAEPVIEPVRATKEQLGRVVRGSREIPVDMPITMATPKAGDSPDYQDPWQKRQ